MTDIKVYENVSIVTFSDVPSRKRFVSTTLTAVAESGINIDMISQTPPKSDMFSFGFTFSYDDIPTLLTVLPKITAVHGITPCVNSGNVKIVIKSEKMIDQAGFAAKVFEACENICADVMLITTSVDEISLLVGDSFATTLPEEIRKILR